MWPETILKKLNDGLSLKTPFGAGACARKRPDRELQELRKEIAEMETQVVHDTAAEEAPVDGERHFRKVFDDGRRAMAVVDPYFHFVRVNAAFCRMLGYTENEMTALTIKDVTHPDHIEADMEAARLLFHGEIPVYRTEKRYFRKDKTIAYAEVAAVAVRDRAGRFQYFLTMAEDITARKNAEDGARFRDEHKYKELANSLPSCIFETDLEGRLTFANQTAFEWFGYSEGEFPAGANVTEMLAEDERPRAAANFHRVMSTGEVSTGEYTVKRKDGSSFPAIVTARSIMKDGTPTGLMGILTDISERIRAEERLQDNEEKYRRLFESANDAIFLMDVDQFIDCNSKTLSMFGCTEKNDIVGHSPMDFSPDVQPDGRRSRDKALEYIGAALEGSPQRFSWKHCRKDGTPFDVEVSLTSLVIGAKKHLLAVVRDVTEKTQAELVQSAVFQISQAADKAASLDELYRSVHSIIGTVMPAGNFYIALYDVEKDVISFPYFVDEEDTPPAPKRPGKGLTEAVLRTGKPLLCDDATDRDLRRRGEVEVVGAPSAIWLGVPLIVDGNTIGVMVVQHYSDPKAYGQRELRMLEYVSSQVAKSIERKKTDASLQTSENILRVFINALPGPALLLDRDEVILEVNEPMARSLGQTRRGLVGQGAFQFVSTESAGLKRAHFQRSLETGQPAVFEDERAGKSFLNYIYPVFDERDRVSRVAVFALDMTARKKVEEALRREKSFSDSIIESLPGAFYCVEAADGKLRYVRWNTSQEKILGYTAEELGRLDPLESIAEEERAIVAEKIQEVLANGNASVETHLRAKDGRRFPVLLTGSRAEIEGRTYILGTSIDIGRRKQAEEALRDSEELYRRLVGAIPDMILRTDLDGRILFANDVALRLGGFAGIEELIGKNVFSFVAPADREGAVSTAQIMFTKRLGPQQFRLVLKEGIETLFEVNGSVLRNSGGTPYGMVFLCRDITERKQAEEDLRHSVKQLRSTLKAAIDSLASAIEMRDPYTAGHQERVTKLASAIAAEMGLAEDRIEGIQIAGVIHDIGKLYVPAEILSKPTKLNAIEYAMIKMHSQVGYTILSKIAFPWPIAQIVHQHHESVNGSGYPLGLTGKDILLEAKILCVADVVEAMSSHRPYRPAMGIQAALEEVSQKRGLLYDREVVEACLHLFSERKFKFD